MVFRSLPYTYHSLVCTDPPVLVKLAYLSTGGSVQTRLVKTSESWWVCNSELNGDDSTSGSAETLMWPEPFLILAFLQHSATAKDLYFILFLTSSLPQHLARNPFL